MDAAERASELRKDVDALKQKLSEMSADDGEYSKVSEKLAATEAEAFEAEEVRRSCHYLLINANVCGV